MKKMRKMEQIDKFIKLYGRKFEFKAAKVGRKRINHEEILKAVLMKISFGFSFRVLEELTHISKATLNNHYNYWQKSGKIDKTFNTFLLKKK